MQIEFTDTAPSVEQFRELRRDAGLSAFSPMATQIALENTLHGVWLRREDRLIGMGRLIGDGGCFAHVTDIAVHPDYQQQGFGRKIVSRLMQWADSNLPSGCYISLIADPGAEKLYEKQGFSMRTGMARLVP